MEQGPVLEGLGLPLAPVAAIAGQTRLTVAIAGSQVPEVVDSLKPKTPCLVADAQSDWALSHAYWAISCSSLQKRPA